jgi:hypothetical protein
VRARAGHRTQKVSNTAKKDGALAPVRVAGQTVRACMIVLICASVAAGSAAWSGVGVYMHE